MRFIEPFKNLDNISAYFTEANRLSINKDGKIPGLNLGHNTPVDESEVNNNFSVLFKNLGWSSGDIALAEQVHGSHIEVVEKTGIYPATDGLITKTKNLPIGIRVADCAAILVADPNKSIIGVFHAGWRGAADNILSKGLKLMQTEGADINNLHVYLSPCIMQENFEVGEEVAIQFPKEFVNHTNYEKPHVDLQGFLKDQCLKSGVNKSKIDLLSECTLANDKYYSFRREREMAGRMLTVMKLNQ